MSKARGSCGMWWVVVGRRVGSAGGRWRGWVADGGDVGGGPAEERPLRLGDGEKKG